MPKTYVLITILFSGAALRLYNLTTISLWHDEAFSALLIRYPPGEMIQRIALDVHPPLYYLLLRAWDFILGDSLFSLRLFSAICGVLTVFFAYLFVKEAFKNERLALISALLIALNPFQIQYSVEARMYTLGTFLIVFSSWLLVKAIEFTPLENKSDIKGELYNAPSQKVKLAILFDNFLMEARRYKWWIFYGISAALAIYTHYYLIFSAAAQAIFIAFTIAKNHKSNFTPIPLGNGVSKYTWKPRFQVFTGVAVAYLAAFLIFLPWLKIFLKQLSQVEQNYWIPKMSASSIPNTIWRMIGGSNVDLSSNGDVNNIMLAIVSLLFMAILFLVFKRETSQYKHLVIFSFLIPFILAIALSAKRSLYLDRYFVFAGLFYLMIFAIFFENIKSKMIKNILISAFIAASLFLFYQNWKVISPQNKQGMASASGYIFKNARPDEKVFVGSTFIFFTYKYYAYQNYFYDAGYSEDFNPSALKPEDNIWEGYRIYPEYLTPLLYTPGITRVEQLPHFSGTALLTTSDLLNDFSSKAESGNIIWVLWTTGFGSGKLKTPKDWRQEEEEEFQDVFGYRGKIGVTKYRVQ